jgi:hypothetical protein
VHNNNTTTTTMASVTSLDSDMRNLRMSRYTPQAANEARAWIEDTLGRSLPSGDLLDALKDGVALCELANLVLPPPGVKFKKSQMPFIQMENISQFLKACEMPPLNLHKCCSVLVLSHARHMRQIRPSSGQQLAPRNRAMLWRHLQSGPSRQMDLAQ